MAVGRHEEIKARIIADNKDYLYYSQQTMCISKQITEIIK